MISGIGVDILEVGRMERAMRIKGFREKVFTSVEIAYCESKGTHRIESYAARFAAKEAMGKALGTGVQVSQLQQIEVISGEDGRPTLCFSGDVARLAKSLKVKKAYISLSHTAENAVAQVILETAQ